MTKSNNAFIKRQKELIKKKKKEDKEQRKQERKKNSAGGNFEDMIAYVDEFGNPTSKPPGTLEGKDNDNQVKPNNN